MGRVRRIAMNKSMVYEQIFIQRFAKIFIEKFIVSVQIIEEESNRKQVLDFLVSLLSEELKYFIEPYKYKCPIILSIIKDYKKSLFRAFAEYHVVLKNNELDEYCILILKECLKYLNKELERLK